MNTAKLIFNAKLILQQQHFKNPRRLVALSQIIARATLSPDDY